MYVTELEKSNYSNPGYRSHKLKFKLEGHEPFTDRLLFCHLSEFHSYIILFSSDIDLNTAVKQAFMIGSANMIQNAGLHLRQCVMDDFSNAPDLTWPPAPSDLTKIDDAIPSTLRRMMCYIITGKKSTTSSQSQRLIQSIGLAELLQMDPASYQNTSKTNRCIW